MDIPKARKYDIRFYFHEYMQFTAIVCSKVDPASMNIKEKIIEMLGENESKEKNNMKLTYLNEDVCIVEIENRLIYADNIDERISKAFDIKLKEIVFASRHTSKDGRKLLSCHVSGNVSTADYGGKPYSLAKPSPITMKNYSLSLVKKMKEYKLDYMFSLEVTHHGPSEIKVPSAFYEIGSTEKEWRDELAAKLVAESIIEALKSEKKDWIVAVGVGGTHYAPRQTELELNTNLAFAHNFAKYTFEGLNKEFLKKAIEISEAEVVVIDEKSTISKIKNMVLEVCDDLNIKMYKTKQAKKDFAPVG